jgi:hypothetical protein
MTDYRDWRQNPVVNKCYLTISCNHYRDWRQPFNPVIKVIMKIKTKKIQIYRVFPVCIAILSCSVYRVSSALLHFLTAHITGFSLFVLLFCAVPQREKSNIFLSLLTWTPPETPGVSKDAPLSTKLGF